MLTPFSAWVLALAQVWGQQLRLRRQLRHVGAVIGGRGRQPSPWGQRSRTLARSGASHPGPRLVGSAAVAAVSGLARAAVGLLAACLHWACGRAARTEAGAPWLCWPAHWQKLLHCWCHCGWHHCCGHCCSWCRWLRQEGCWYHQGGWGGGFHCQASHLWLAECGWEVLLWLAYAPPGSTALREPRHRCMGVWLACPMPADGSST